MKNLKKTRGWLVMAAALTVGLSACSSSEDSIIEQPENSTEKTYTLTVTATKSTDEATTRALSIDNTGALNATWEENEEVQVYHVFNPGTPTEMESTTPDATLRAQSSGATTTLTGTFTGSYTPAAGDVLRLRFNDNPNYSNQEGTLDYIATHCDYALAEISIASVDTETGNVTASGTAEFENKQAIVKFSLKEPDGTTPLPVTSLKVKVVGSGTYNVTPATAASDIYVAVRSASNRNVELTAISADADGYTYTKSGVTFTTDQYYAIGVKMTADHPYTTTVNLSALQGDYIAPDYTILTGTLGGGHKISIADGATVKLRDVTIPGGNNENEPWAGITCEGNAIIKLSGTNSVKGYNHFYSGIQPGGAGTTLTIEGSGTLTATYGGGGTGEYGAGIGGGQGQEVGNIVIKGGDITAIGCHGAGIGGGNHGICGNITISGGTITATNNGSGAGIGTGKGSETSVSSCGTITISGGTITATGGYGAAGIGSGLCSDGSGGSRCGDITITGGTITATGGSFTSGPFNGGAAGIGSGRQAWCDNITISGTATGTATHGANNNHTCYDIGTGNHGLCYDDPQNKIRGTVSVASGTISGTIGVQE